MSRRRWGWHGVGSNTNDQRAVTNIDTMEIGVYSVIVRSYKESANIQ